MIGSQIALVALTFRIYDLTGSAVWVSAVFLVTLTAHGIVTPIGGWLADHYPRRRVMILSDIGAALAFAGLMVADQPWLLIVLALCGTIAEAPFFPASQGALPNLAAPDELTWANGLFAQAFSIGIAVGPLVGGALIAVGPELAFGVNALTFLVSAAAVAGIRGRFEERRAAYGVEAERIPLRAAGAFTWHERTLRTVVLAEVVAFSVIGWAMVANAPLAKLFDVGSLGYASLVAFWGVGMLVGSWSVGRWLRPGSEAIVLLGGMVLDGVMVAMMGLMPLFGMVLAVSVLGGAGSGGLGVARQTLLQGYVPDRMRASVFAVAQAVSNVSYTAGLALAGPAIELIGVRPAYVVSGVVFAAGALLLLPLVRGVRGVAMEPG